MRTVPFALLVCVHVPLLACSRDERPAPAAYAVDSGAKALARDSAPDAASSAAPPPHARTDAHDYRGTLGTKTAIALHLDRFATTAVGSYVYTSVGVPIGFSGTLDSAGGLVLTESVQGKSTGTLRLAVSGDDLVGTWTGASASKTFPVRLSPWAPWVATKTVKPGEIWKRAEACLADPTCSADDAARGFVEADDTDTWPMQSHAARGALGRQSKLRYQAITGENKPDDWPGPGQVYAGFPKDDTQWNFWLRYSEFMEGRPW